MFFRSLRMLIHSSRWAEAAPSVAFFLMSGVFTCSHLCCLLGHSIPHRRFSGLTFLSVFPRLSPILFALGCLSTFSPVDRLSAHFFVLLFLLPPPFAVRTLPIPLALRYPLDQKKFFNFCCLYCWVFLAIFSRFLVTFAFSQPFFPSTIFFFRP